jgi:hypothetical protein
MLFSRLSDASQGLRARLSEALSVLPELERRSKAR